MRKISDAERSQVRRLRRAGNSIRKIAYITGISSTTVFEICQESVAKKEPPKPTMTAPLAESLKKFKK